MKNTILAITFFIFGWSAPLSAEVMTYQGRLKESNVPVNANRVFSFKFCDAESFGNCDTTPSGFQSFTVQNGLFKSTFTIPASNLTQGEWYLQVSVGVDAPSIQDLSPRERLTAVPYSVYSATAGYSPAALQKAGDTMTGQLTSISSVTITGNGGVYGLQVSSNVSLAGALYSANGNVGIGTAAPQYPLVVLGNPAGNIINAGDAANPWGATAGFGLDDFNTYPGAALYVNNAKVFNVESNGGAILGSTYMTADAVRNGLIVQGHVGIGTALPNYALEISSGAGEAGTIMSVSTGATNLFWVAGDGAHSIKFTGDGSGLTGVTGAAGTDSSKLPLTGGTLAGQLTLAGSTLTVTGDAFSVGGSTLVVVNGNVGIGTTGPDERLDMAGGNITMGPLDSAGGIYFRDGAVYNVGIEATDHNGSGKDGLKLFGGDGVSFFASEINERMRITPGGNIGIGTTNPAYRLVVSSGAGESGTIMAVSTGATNIFTVDGSGVNALRFTGDGSGLTGVTAAGAVLKSGDTMTGDLMMTGASTITVAGSGFSVGGSTFAVTYGRVGIGTAAPGRALDVQLPAGVNDDGIRVTARSGIRLDLYSNQADVNARNWSLLSNNPRFGDFSVRRSNSMGGDPNLNGTTAMYLAREGNIGFSNDLPLYRLHVSSGAGEAGIVMAVSTGTSNIFWVAGDGAYATRFVGDGSGLTGVTGASGTDSTRVLKTGDTMTGQLTNTSSVTITGNGGGAYGLEVSSNISLAGALYSSNGNVGIGTLNPQYGLDIGNGTNGISQTMRIKVGSGGSDKASLLLSGPVYAGSIVYDAGNAGNITIANSFNGADPFGNILFQTNGSTERLRITRAGNVGVGATAPDQKLTVAGNISQTGVLISSGAGDNYFAGNVGIGTAGQGAKLHVVGGGGTLIDIDNPDGTIGGQLMVRGQANPNRQLWLGYDTTNNYGLVQAYEQTMSAKPLVLQPNSGNVGIGATAPDQKLTVAGNISQTGVLISSGAGSNYFAGDVTAARYQIGGSTVLALLPGIGSMAVGPMAGAVSAGAYNLFIGSAAGKVNSSGLHNVLVGYGAGQNNLTGTGNTFIGSSAGSANSTGLQNIVIGYNQQTSASDSASELNIGGVLFGRLGEKAIGISTRAPQAALDVVSTGTAANVYAQIWRDGGGNVVSSVSSQGVFYGDGSALTGVSGSDVTKLPLAGGFMSGQLTNTSSVTITGNGGGAYGLEVSSNISLAGALYSANGKVGIGTTSPADLFVVAGSLGNIGIPTNGNSIRYTYNGINYIQADGALSELRIRTGGTDRMVIKTAGNIGIGTTAPATKFEVAGGSVTISGAEAGLLFDGPSRKIAPTTSVTEGAGLYVSTHVYIIGFSSAAKYYGDGSALTGVSGSDVTKLPLGGGTLTGQLTLSGSSLTVTGAVAGQSYSANGIILFSSDGVKATDNLNPVSSITIAAGGGVTGGTPKAGGYVSILSGKAEGSGFPIDVGFGGDVRIFARKGANARGGDVLIKSGRTDGYASAGQRSVIDLDAGGYDKDVTDTTGGRVLIEAPTWPDGGGSGGTYQRGGHVTITGGNGTTGTGGSGTGGNIVLKPGTGPGGLGNVGISTGVPQARLDVLAGGSAQTDMAQLWRNSAGTIVSSVSATGVLMAGKFIGDGSGLTGVSASDASKLPLAGGTMAGDITMGGNDLYAVSTITATGDITAARYQIAGSTVLAILPGTGSLGVGVSAGRVNVGTSNSFLGYQAGYSNTTGSNNSFLGYNAGAADSTGGENSFLGSYTGFNNTTGGSNSFLGTFVGYSNTTGFNNSFLGTYAGYSNTTGSNNSFLGTYAGYNTKAGSANAVFGTDAGKGVLNNSFSSATIMGYQAGFGLTTGSDNIFLGFQTGYNVTTGTGNILIGYGKDTSAPGANNELNIGGVLYGDLSAKTIGISRKAPEAALDIVSTGTVQTQFAQIWRDSAGVIKSSMSATGVLMAGKFIGDGSGLNGVAATDATKLPIAGGFMSGQLTNTSSVTITGNGGAYGLQVSSNVSLAGALYSANGNIGIGTTTPQGLLHVGAGATPGLLVDSAGYLGIGTVNPSYSLHVVKTAGNIAGYFQSSDSTGSGIYLAATGALGRSYGLFSTASGLLGGGKFTIYDPGAAAYRLTIDAVGYVGIGTTAPDQKLTVAGNISQTGVLISSGTGNNYFAGNVGIAAPSPAGLFQVGGGSLTVLAGGNVGVGTTAPQSHLHVDDALNATLAGAANLALLVRHNTITAGGGPGIGFSSDNTASVGAKIVHLRTGSNSQGDLAFYTKTSNGVPESQKMIIKDSGNVGISTGAPEARLDVLAGGSAQTDMAQLWRNSAGAIVSSVSATGVMMASKFIGDGSGLAGISANDVTKLPLNGGVLNGWLEVGNNSTMTVTGNAFSVGGSTLVVAAGHVGINWSTPDAPLVVNAMSGETYIAKLGTSGINISIGGAIQTTGTGHGAISGNPRGIGAVDLQTKRTNATYVASGDYSALLGGYDNRATGNNSAVLSGFFNAASGVSAAVLTGISNTASNSYAAVGGGRDNTASGTSSFIGGGGRDGSGYPPQGNTASQAFAAIAGGAFNVVSGSNSFIGAGAYNVVTGTSAVTAGGEGNKASGMWSAIGGGRVNNASGIYSAVSGGTNNTASGGYSAVAGGNANVATGLLAAVSGGDSNTASGQYSAVAGGMNNISSGEMSVVSGGRYNESAGHNSFIGGGGVDAGGYGGANKAQGDWSGIVAGIFNVVSGSSSFVGGGAYNVAAGTSSVIAGGDNNRTENFFSSVGGGKSNTARDLYATVGGGSTNNANNSLATIGGGGFHTIDAPYGTVAGGNNNKIQSFATAGFIGGGENNISTGAYSAIGGGRVNSSSGAYSAVLGGYGNAAEGAYSAVAGGNTNRAYGANSAVSGGKLNSALGDFSAIAGGDNNSANAPDSIVAGGNFNLAGGQLSAVAGGNYNAALGMASFIGGGGSNKTGLTAWGAVAFGANNAAMGQYSFAAGRTSTSAYDGSFTWADSQGIDVVNNIPDQVMFKAKGGFWVSTGTVYTNPALYIDAGNNIGIGTAFPTAKLHLANAGDGIKFPDGSLMTTAGVGSASNLANITDALINGDSDSNLTGSVRLQTSGLDRLYVSTNGNVGIGTTLPSALLDVNGTARLARQLVESRDAGGTMSAADFGKTITVNSGSPQAIMLPVGAAGSVGAQFTFVKLGAGTVTITAGATDYIADSSMAGSIYNALAAETYATITLRLTTSTRWSIVGGNGSWTTN